MNIGNNSTEAFVLHRRSYRESSFIVDWLTATQGRVVGILKGARRKKESTPEPYTRYLISWRGRGPMVTVTQLEELDELRPSGIALYAALYVNELMMRSTRPAELLEEIYEAYRVVLRDLKTKDIDVEPTLRRFEKQVLKGLGYEVVFDLDGIQGMPIDPDARYRFELGKGFCMESGSATDVYQGSTLLAISAEDFRSQPSRRAAKLILRQALRPVIGDAPLSSRELLQAKSYGAEHRSMEPSNGPA